MDGCLNGSHWIICFSSHHPIYNTDNNHHHNRIQFKSNQFSVESYQPLSQHHHRTIHHH